MKEYQPVRDSVGGFLRCCKTGTQLDLVLLLRQLDHAVYDKVGLEAQLAGSSLLH